MTDLKILTIQVKELAIRIGQFIHKERKTFSIHQIEEKGKHDFVTYVDKASEKQIVEGLARLFPESGFIVEENTSTVRHTRFNWIVDPLDGTTNFIHGLPPYAMSIALMDGIEIVLGVIYEITLNECFYAWKDGGAWLNGNKINVTDCSNIDKALVATGFPYSNYSRLGAFMKTLNYFMQHSHGLRRLGSAATDMAYVACGRFDAFYEYGLQAWDVAAGVILIHEAGGKVSDFTGNDDFVFGKEIVATNANLHHDFQKIINEIMNP